MICLRKMILLQSKASIIQTGQRQLLLRTMVLIASHEVQTEDRHDSQKIVTCKPTTT